MGLFGLPGGQKNFFKIKKKKIFLYQNIVKSIKIVLSALLEGKTFKMAIIQPVFLPRILHYAKLRLSLGHFLAF